MSKRQITAGQPEPLGSHFDGRGVNFAVFAANAERVELNLFEGDACARLDLPHCTDGVWHGYVPGLVPGCRYGYRAYGVYAPERGLRFNPNKLLIDPYARWLDSPIVWDPSQYAHVPGTQADDLSFSALDSAASMPKCVVVDERTLRRPIERPGTAWRDTVIYETHVKGLTQLDTTLPESIRGTFAALAAPATVQYLRQLGVTAVELLPIHMFASEAFLLRRELSNYWGYNSVSFFAPHPGYLSTGALPELTQAVDALHAAGLEVILDVVFNHTAEGDALGPTYSFRGLDNLTYYRLQENDKRHYINDAGCGNSLAAYRPPVRQMIVDALVYWYDVIGVDGFRFDLAVSLGRSESGFDARAELLDTLSGHPRLAGAKLIAEPWDVGPDGYRLGAFPAPWAEWNDRYRDCVRRFWRGDHGVLPELATRLHGSSDLFDTPQRGPVASVNFLTSHDGFTLADVTAYSERDNAANGEDNRDGHNENFSDNCGHEGPTEDRAVQARRLRRQRNMLATLLLSQGTPMLLAGDELGHSQGGNNNAYCQDNATTWLNWCGLSADNAMHGFVRQLLGIRRAHPILRRAHFAHGTPVESGQALTDVLWLTPGGDVMQDHHWHEASLRTLAMVLVPTTAEREAGEDVAVIVAINGGPTAAPFKIAGYARPYAFECVLSTVDPSPVVDAGEALVPADALCMFAGQPRT